MPDIRTLDSVYTNLTDRLTHDMERDLSEFGFTQAEAVDFAHGLLLDRFVDDDGIPAERVNSADLSNVMIEMILLGVEWGRARVVSR